MILLLDPRAWLAALLIALASYGAGRWQQRRADQTTQQAAQLQAVQAARAEEQRRTAAQTEIANVATQQATQARADAVAAAAVSERLRQRIAQLGAGHPAAATPGAPAGDPIAVLADVLARSDATAGELAAYADAARIAGNACERAYDALRLGE